MTEPTDAMLRVWDLLAATGTYHTSRMTACRALAGVARIIYNLGCFFRNTAFASLPIRLRHFLRPPWFLHIRSHIRPRGNRSTGTIEIRPRGLVSQIHMFHELFHVGSTQSVGKLLVGKAQEPFAAAETNDSQ